MCVIVAAAHLSNCLSPFGVSGCMTNDCVLGQTVAGLDSKGNVGTPYPEYERSPFLKHSLRGTFRDKGFILRCDSCLRLAAFSRLVDFYLHPHACMGSKTKTARADRLQACGCRCRAFCDGNKSLCGRTPLFTTCVNRV